MLIRLKRSFFTLHQNQIAFEKATLRQDDSSTSEISKYALRSAVRIVMVVSDHFNANISRFNMMAIPPTYTYIIYRAAMSIIMLGDEVDSEQLVNDFQNLRRTCWYMSHRWEIASKSTISFYVPLCLLLLRFCHSVSRLSKLIMLLPNRKLPGYYRPSI